MVHPGKASFITRIRTLKLYLEVIKMSDKKLSNNLTAVRNSLRAEACSKAILRVSNFRKDDGLDRVEIPIHPGQLQMHLFPVFKVEVE